MTIKTHAALAILFCYATCIVICNNSTLLIGFLYGPTSEVDARDQRRSVEAVLLVSIDAIMRGGGGGRSGRSARQIWNNDAETYDAFLAKYDDAAYYGDRRAVVLRDAGIIAAFFALILAMNANYDIASRLKFIILSLPLYVVPGLVGQLAFQRTTPIEILLLNAWGMRGGIACIGYCSVRSLLRGLDEVAEFIGHTILHDVEVVTCAGLLAFLML